MTSLQRIRLWASALRVQLPLVTAGLLVVALTVVGVIVTRALREAALELANERLRRAAKQIALISENSVAGRQARYVAVANDPVVARALRDPSVAPHRIAAAMEPARLPSDSALPLELWTATGRLVYRHPPDSSVPAVAVNSHGLPDYVRGAMRGPGVTLSDSLRHSGMYDEGVRVVIWFVLPLRHGEDVLGFIAHKRRLTAGPITHGILRELSGVPATMYYRNADSSVWAEARGEAVVRTEARRQTAGVLQHEERIGSSDILVGLRVARAAVLAPSRELVRGLWALIALVVVAGVVLSWLLTRRFTRPLVELTTATRTIADGNYGVRVAEGGSSETRDLAVTFNGMAAEIESVRQRLEHETARAQSASAAKSEFLATVSHELRTPLNAIGGYIDLLELELRGPLTPEMRRDLERMRASQRHLLGLINRLLDLARVEARTVKYEMRSVAVGQLLDEVTALMSRQAAISGVSLVGAATDDDLAILADPEKVRQIMLNLLTNAIRHTPAGGDVAVSVEESGPAIEIVVRDSGPGVPPDRRAAIFEPFVQLERSLSSQREGLGLGLAISRDLARGMGGDLVYRDQGRGGCFVVSLQRGAVDAAVLNR